MNFKRSIYTVQAKLPDGSLALLNTFTGAIARIPLKDASNVLEILKGKEPTSDCEIISDLRKGGFIIDKSKNEYREFCSVANPMKYRIDELELIIMPTEQCNFRCVYCYENFTKPQMSEDVKIGILNLFDKRLPILRIFKSSWFGGEPLLAADIVIELSTYFLQQCEKKGVRYLSEMTTNGYFLNQKMAEDMFKCGIRYFQITLDGLRESHDKKRILYGSKGGTFDKIFSNLLALKETKESFHISVRCNIDKENIGTIDAFLEYFAQHFKEDKRFSVFARPVWGADNNHLLCDYNTGRQVRYQFGAKAVAFGLNWTDAAREFAFGGQVCYAARPNSFVIGSDGTIYKCTVAFDLEENKVGTLDSKGNLKLDFSKFSLWTEPWFNGIVKCRSCHFLPICQGVSCPLHSVQKNTNDPTCALGRFGVKRVLEILSRIQKETSPTTSCKITLVESDR
jgi:uncharacterized protein